MAFESDSSDLSGDTCTSHGHSKVQLRAVFPTLHSIHIRIRISRGDVGTPRFGFRVSVVLLLGMLCQA